MNQLQIFENKEFGKIRTVEVNNEPYCGKRCSGYIGIFQRTKSTC